jgi:hypothetical protein
MYKIMDAIKENKFSLLVGASVILGLVWLSQEQSDPVGLVDPDEPV